MKVLAVDDNPIARKVLSAFLTQSNYDAEVVDTPAEVLELLQEEDAPLIVIIDWMMPEMEGTELCAKIRELGLPIQPYLFILSAKKEKEEIAQALDSGADDYIVKPFNILELQARLRVAERSIARQQELLERIERLQGAPSAHASAVSTPTAEPPAPRQEPALAAAVPVSAPVFVPAPPLSVATAVFPPLSTATAPSSPATPAAITLPPAASVAPGKPATPPVATAAPKLPGLTSRQIDGVFVEALRSTGISFAGMKAQRPNGAPAFATWSGLLFASESIWLDVLLALDEASATSLFGLKNGAQETSKTALAKFCAEIHRSVDQCFRTFIAGRNSEVFTPLPLSTVDPEGPTLFTGPPNATYRAHYSVAGTTITLVVQQHPCPLQRLPPGELKLGDILADAVPGTDSPKKGATLDRTALAQMAARKTVLPVHRPSALVAQFIEHPAAVA
jgi:phosphoserine phosphatase RsbU/P